MVCNRRRMIVCTLVLLASCSRPQSGRIPLQSGRQTSFPPTSMQAVKRVAGPTPTILSLLTLRSRLYATQTAQVAEARSTSVSVVSTAEASVPLTCQVFDPEGSHLWNRLFCALNARVGPDGTIYGVHDLDTHHWNTSKHLIYGASHDTAIAVLDEFLGTSGERLITDPRKRALLQRDLWAIFDWLHNRNDEGVRYREIRADLQWRLVAVMRRVALSRREIAALPDNYAAAVDSHVFPSQFTAQDPERTFLPPDLFAINVGWVLMGGQDRPLAEFHTEAQIGSRSVWLVFLRHPGGREETKKFVQSLAQDNGATNPPTLYPGMEALLMRRMLLIDDSGEIVPSPVTESVQIRHYTRPGSRGQRVFDLKLLREGLFREEGGGLSAVEPSERTLIFLNPSDDDPLEPEEYDVTRGDMGLPILAECRNCHDHAPTDMGARSIQSYSRELTGVRNPHELVISTAELESMLTVLRKQSTPEWQSLQSLWQP